MKYSDWSVSVVSPVYNNRRTLEGVISRLDLLLKDFTKQYEIVLIDDGSTDNSQDLVKTLQKQNRHIRFLSHKKNLGIAKTYRHLYKEALFDHIVLFSLDSEWDPEDVIKLLRAAYQTKSDIVIGQRTNKAYSTIRLFISETYNLLTKLLFGVNTYDAGSIKYLHKKIIKSIPIHSKGVFDEAERIIRAAHKGYNIHSIPVSHFASPKTKSLRVKWSLLLQAIQDMGRVWIDITISRIRF